ncbi:hypothetical protein JKF63_05091 [Porcisia hertigi]|uniref:Kinesin motor domain-containing protein n=1 Tax=Porcisia hertigi TaxID=2761500 RepID=A0A836IJE2_9TRYP|nr:hypothetical protein JKF63_05091 [Porcisia hertigi]
MGRRAAQGGYPDDGHIFVCVRVRDVPQNAAFLTCNANAATNTRASTVARKSVVRDAQRICVSVVENVVVMHDPASVDDDATVAKDGSNVVQMLTDRATLTGVARPLRKTAAATSRTSSRRTAVLGDHRVTTAGSGASTHHLISTGTANYYEFDDCIASMEESQLLQMPLIRTSDFLPPPLYGTQEDVYRCTAMRAVEAAIEGINSCVFAYGQTGSGKTYTLFGDTTHMHRDPGIVPRTLDDLFVRLEALKLSYRSDKETEYSYNVHLSFYEIYQNEVYCLFSRQGPLHVQFVRDSAGKKETMIIHDLLQQAVTSAEKAYPLIEMGLRRRQTSETGMNARSSRSHAVLQIRVAQYRTSRHTREGVEHQATVNLVDLAGSERQKTANTSGSSRAEGIQINQSLATLARVINDIASGAKFVNYRDSLLTMVLKDNLGGNSKTFMIANISPIAFSYQESCATLTYAKAVRRIRNRPMVNKNFQTRANLLEQNMFLKQENEKLKEQMEAWVRGLRSGHSHAAEMDAADLHPVGGGGMTEGPSGPLSPSSLMSKAFTNEQPCAAGVPLPTLRCNEAFLSAASSGLTAPLLIASHRRYTSLAGIGGSCVEGGVVCVSSLVKETMEFSLSRVLHPLPRVKATDSPHTADAKVAQGMDLGSLVLERVSQRSLELRYYVHFNPPATDEGLSRLVDVQVNGKSLRAKGRRELHHGDVVCAYLEDDAKVEEAAAADAATGTSLHAQSLISFHYVDLNALSRSPSVSTSGMASATLGQIAVSVDLPEGMEHLTLEGIKQLQRDNAKLLDLVREQAETINYHCAHTSVSMQTETLMGGISPVGSPGSVSPNPRSLEPSSADSLPPPAVARRTAAALEAFRRLSVSPSIRGGSVMPADLETNELLSRLGTQSQSHQHPNSVLPENRKPHRTTLPGNATLEALARRLAELEAGGRPKALASSISSSSSRSSPSVSISPSAEMDYNFEASRDISADGKRDEERGSTMTARSGQGSIACVSSPSQMRAVSAQHRSEGVVEARTDGHEPQPEPIGDGQRRIVYENTEGVRERFQSVVREREKFEYILRLEALISELRVQISELESRLRFSRDETLEQQMSREGVEAHRDALLGELASLHSENSALRTENASLEAFLARDEQALTDAARIADEELQRQVAVLADRNRALTTLARMWKQRTMKYIAMSYGAGRDDKDASSTRAAHLEAIPWDDLRAAETVAIAKRRLGGGDADSCSAEAARTIEAFEKATAEENMRALEYALLHFDNENQRLLDEIRRIQLELDGHKDLIERLRMEKAQMEKALVGTTDSTEEERRRMQQLLHNTNVQLEEAERNVKQTQSRLDDAVAMRNNNKRKAEKNNELLLAQQKRTIEELERELSRMRREYKAKEEEATTLTRHFQDRVGLGVDSVAKIPELHSRIEELVNDSMEDYEAPNGYSVFPAGFEFSDEMTSLIRICLRILLDRLKMELYVLNAQSVHKFVLLINAVKVRTEAHFHTFMHQLRDAVSQMSRRTLRPGGKWGLSESDVLSTLVDHRRRQVGDALNGLLIWYDHWDSAPKTEHVAYMELIRNTDCIMHMARIVRRESSLNTNATSTSLMPIPGKNGSSDTSLISSSARRNDTTVKGSCKILSRLASSVRQSNLARALNQFSATPSRATIAGKEDVLGSTPPSAEEAPASFSRSATATALALSQSMIPFSRSATCTRGSGHQQPPAAHPEGSPTFTRCPSGLPRRGTAAAPVLSFSPQHHSSVATPMRSTNPAANGGSTTPAAMMATDATPTASTATAAAARANYSRMASTGVLPVSEADVAYVANSDVAEAVSISTYNFSRRMSSAAGIGASAGATADKGELVRQASCLFSRCQTAIPQTRSCRQQHQNALCRQASAVMAPSKTRIDAGTSENRRRTPLTKTTEAFTRSKTHTTISKSTMKPSRLSCRGSGVLGEGSPCARPSSSRPKATRLSAVQRNSMAEGAPGGTGNGRVSTLNRDADVKSSAPAISFYNPDVLKSLRERSTSDVNRVLPVADGTDVSVKKTGLPSNSSKHGKSKKARSATSSSAFEKTSTGARMSTGHSAPISSAASALPKLDFSTL